MKNYYPFSVKSIFIILISLSSFFSYNAQNWTQNLPQRKLNSGTLNFYDIQNAFYSEFPKDSFPNGTKVVRNNIQKIPEWKLFKRWEWQMETRVDKQSGDFPTKSASQVLNEFNQQRTAINGGGNWTSLGPSSSWSGYYGTGRLNCVTFHPNNNNIFWVGSPSGGLWKTTDGGVNWTVSTDDNDVLGVSTIALDPNYINNNTIYIGTGDRDGGSMWSLGGGQFNDNNSIGILKSTDDGQTWNTTGLTFTTDQKRTVNEILINPNNSQIMFAATSVGIYKSADGGNNWTVKTSSNDFVDMDFKPGSFSTLYASTTSWGNSKIFKSDDDGENWTEVLSVAGRRIQIAVTPNNSNIVYAVAANPSKGLEGIYKSTNSGSTFNNIFSGANASMLGYNCDGSGDNTGQGAYDLCLAADPTNANIIFLGGVNTWKSTDGGNTWNINNMWTNNSCGSPVIHADKHYLAFQNGTSTLFECNDGGIYKTSNGGNNWVDVTGNMITSQMYRLGVSSLSNNHLLCGLQDNGTKSIQNNNWSNVTGGDGMECIIDYTNSNIQYGCIQNGKLRRTTNNWNSAQVITDNGILNGLDGAWVSPYTLDPNNHETIFLGFKELYKSTDKGDTWTQLTNLNITNELRSVVIAPSNNQFIYMSDLDNLWKTTDGGSSWVDITSNLPSFTNDITYIAIKHNDPNTLWITLGQFNNKKVYESIDGGVSWTNISNGLPSLPVMSIVQNKQNTVENELYVGTDVGVYQKLGTNSWTPYCTGLPNVVVTELEIYYDPNNSDDSKLWAATFGRGLWSSPLPSLFATQNPTALNASPVSQTQIDLTWNKNANNDNVVLAWSSTNSFGSPTNGITYNPGDNIPGGGTVIYEGNLNSFNHTSLTANTQYFYKIWSFDGNDYSSGQTTDATTLCGDISLFPYFQGFEGGIMPPDCWTTFRGTNNQGANDWVINSTNVKSGSFSAFVQYENVTNIAEDWLVSPKIILPNSITSASLEYWERDTYPQNYNSIYKIKVSTSSQTDHSTFTDLSSYTELDLSTSYTQNTIDLSAYIGQEIYIAFVLIQDNGDDWYLDDIQFNTGSCNSPSSLNASNITQNSADLSWVAGGTETTWELTWGPQGFNTGSGNLVPMLNNNNYNLNGLSANSSYDFYVKADCGFGTGSTNLSSWAGPYNFTTLPTICSTTYSTDTQTACDSLVWLDGITYKSDNNYATYTTTNSNGCDSIITLNLTITKWDLVWSDEFNVDGTVDNSKWFHQTYVPNGWGWFNGELQHYTDRTDNSYVQNGNLHIVAKSETYTDPVQGITKNYTSARLNSKFAFTYGRVEARAKLPNGIGTWPAIWMLGKNINETGAYWQTQGFGTTNWPDCGEIDIMEHWGSNQNYIQSALHTPSSNGNTINHGGLMANDVSNNFHLYAMEWYADKIVFSLDGVEYYTYAPNPQNMSTWPFIDDQYILLNIAIASNIDPLFNQSDMVLDFVRVYQQNSTSSSATDIQTACDSYTWIDGNTYNSSNNSATFTLTNSNGCDSIVTLDLTINNSTISSDIHSSCNSFTWIDGNTYSASNNTATFIIANSNGCDSIINLDLTIHNNYSDTVFVTDCDTYQWNNNTYNQSGDYVDSNQTIYGCDSLKYLNLTINNSYNDTLNITVCDSFQWNNNIYTSSGLYSNNYSSINNCDSLVTIDLSVNNNIISPLNLELILDWYCLETYWIIKDSQDSLWYDEGPYNCNPNGGGPQANDTVFANINLDPNECYTFELHDQYGDGMSANNYDTSLTNGNWILKDDNGNIMLQGSGNFGNVISTEFYVDSAILSSIEKFNNKVSKLKAQPNPFKESTLITIKNTKGPYEIEIFDINGRMIYQTKEINNTFHIKNKNISKGIYWLRIKNQPKLIPLKLVIE